MTRRRKTATLASQPGSQGCSRGTAIRLVGGLMLAAAVAFVALQYFSAPAVDTMIDEARSALEQRDFSRAKQLVEQLLAAAPRQSQVRLLAGETEMARGQFPEALAHFEAVDDQSREAAVACRLAGDIQLLHYGRLTAAEQLFRRTLERNPGDLLANEHLAYVLGVSSRNWDLIPYRLSLIEQNRIEPLHLYLLSLSDAAMENDNLVPEYHQRAPEDPGPLLALSRLAYEQQDYARARDYARQAVERAPKLPEAHAKLGRVLLHFGSSAEFAAWRANLPDEALQHPGIWAVLGGWARDHAALPSAIRCFWETVKIDANHQQANYQLGRALNELGRGEQGTLFLERADRLQRYVNAVKLAVETNTRDGLEQAGGLAESLGLVWEAYAWNYLAAMQDGEHGRFADKCQQLRAQYFDRARPTKRNLASANPALQVDLSDFPILQLDGVESPQRDPVTSDAPAVGQFQEEAATRGLDFRYFNGGDPQDIRKMYEFTGGGAATIDLDGDTWPDVYLTQGSSWPPSAEQQEHLDRLFRHTGTGFVDVTERSGIREGAFSQGVAVGDYDNDGFADLYVGNIGANQLFHNNGDGTFTAVKHANDEHDQRWTTSCLIVDLNDDGLPDLYDVNYLRGENIFTVECGGRGVCMPQTFPAEQDQLYLNLGDGRFINITAEAGIEVDGGKGLGIVAADFDEDSAIDLFIANDSETNRYFRSAPHSDTEPPRLVEEAMLRGVAMNRDGRAEACMGIAAGDANGDGRLDLYVTNFYLESNTLYLQDSGGSFYDATHHAKLHDASMHVLGFGTQFIDVDLDGWPDLFVANGHIDDLREDGQPFRMRPQFYRNVGQGAFVEQTGIAGYFSGEYLGRAVARLDWNKDGREDLLVGHLDAPAALLTNQTTPAGNYLAIQLRGTDRARDAIGAIVRVETSGRTLVRHVTAGDGYQTSNERRIVFGLGDASVVDRLIVRWPSARSQTFTNVAAKTELLLLENCDVPFELHPLAK